MCIKAYCKICDRKGEDPYRTASHCDRYYRRGHRPCSHPIVERRVCHQCEYRFPGPSTQDLHIGRGDEGHRRGGFRARMSDLLGASTGPPEQDISRNWLFGGRERRERRERRAPMPHHREEPPMFSPQPQFRHGPGSFPPEPHFHQDPGILFPGQPAGPSAPPFYVRAPSGVLLGPHGRFYDDPRMQARANRQRARDMEFLHQEGDGPFREWKRMLPPNQLDVIRPRSVSFEGTGRSMGRPIMGGNSHGHWHPPADGSHVFWSDWEIEEM